MNNQVKIDYAITSPNGKTDRFTSTLNLPDGFKIDQLGQDPIKFVKNSFLLTCLSVAKGVGYGDSWRGGKGASKFKAEMVCTLGNILRKYDRVMNCAERGIIDGRIDGNGDLSVYSNLYMQLLEELYPDAYKEWMQKDVVDFINKVTKPVEPIVI